MRILILRGGALGDFLITLPALRALRRHLPAAEIELVGNARAAELAILSGELNAAHSQHEARWAPLFSEESLPLPLRAWLDGFDLILNAWPDPDRTLQIHLARPRGQCFHVGARVATRPAALHFLEPLRSLGVHGAATDTRLPLPDRFVREADQRLGGFRNFVALHPGSGSLAKNWPADRWFAVLEQLRQPVLLITGEAERDAFPLPEDLFVQRAHAWPLPSLAGALTRCRIYLGHDTGVSHLAAAMGAPCLLLFGPTDPAIWAPPGNHVHVIQRDRDIASIDVATVLQALAAGQGYSDAFQPQMNTDSHG